MTDMETIRRLYPTRQWETAQHQAQKAKRRNWVIVVMGVGIIVVAALLWASNGTLRGL